MLFSNPVRILSGTMAFVMIATTSALAYPTSQQDLPGVDELGALFTEAAKLGVKLFGADGNTELSLQGAQEGKRPEEVLIEAGVSSFVRVRLSKTSGVPKLQIALMKKGEKLTATNISSVSLPTLGSDGGGEQFNSFRSQVRQTLSQILATEMQSGSEGALTRVLNGVGIAIQVIGWAAAIVGTAYAVGAYALSDALSGFIGGNVTLPKFLAAEGIVLGAGALLWYLGHLLRD